MTKEYRKAIHVMVTSEDPAPIARTSLFLAQQNRFFEAEKLISLRKTFEIRGHLSLTEVRF